MAKRSGGGFSLSKLAFWLVIVIGITMAIFYTLNWLNGAFGWNWKWVAAATAWVQSICFILGMLVVVAISYNHARHRGNTWFILWIVFTVLVVYGLVSNLIGLIF